MWVHGTSFLLEASGGECFIVLCCLSSACGPFLQYSDLLILLSHLPLSTMTRLPVLRRLVRTFMSLTR